MPCSRCACRSVTCGSFSVFDPYQRSGETRRFPILGQHQRDRLSVEQDPVIVKRAIGRSLFRRDVVLVGVVAVGHRRPMLMGKDVDDAGDAQCLAGIDTADAPFRYGRPDDIALDEAGDVELAGIFGFAGDLGPAVDARGSCSDIGCHGAHRIFLTDCDCGVPRAAWLSVRTMARRASPILKLLCP